MKFNEMFANQKLPEPLKNEDLYNCFKKMKLGDMTARNKIINHNIKLVINEVIKKFSNTHYDLNDLVSIGVIGLIKSVDTFDISKGKPFVPYSIRCINNEILMFIRKGKKYINDISLDQPMGADKNGNELKVEDILSDTNYDMVSEYENNESYKVIRNIVGQLPERDKNIIIKYFGFGDNKPMKQQAIADELGIHRTSVSQIIGRVLKKVSIELKTLGIIEVSYQGGKVMPKKTQTIYEYFNEYTREQINEVLSKLDDEEKALITLRYGDDLDNPTTSKEWDMKCSGKYYNVLVPKIKKLLVNPEHKFRNKKNKIAKDVITPKETASVSSSTTKSTSLNQFTKDITTECVKKTISENNQEVRAISKEDYVRGLELLKISNFGQMLNLLTPKEAIIVCLKLGYVDGKYFTTESISEFLGIAQEEVIESTKKILLLYKDSINEFIDKAVEYVTDQQNQNMLIKNN